LPPNGPDADGFESFTDDELTRWFADRVSETAEFHDLTLEASASHEAKSLGDAAYDGIDPELVEAMKVLEGHAAALFSYRSRVGSALDPSEWAFEFGRLSREYKIKFLNGWERDHPFEIVGLPDDGVGGGWWRWRGKRAGWLAVPVVLIVVGATVLAEGFIGSDDDEIGTTALIDQVDEPTVTEPIATEPTSTEPAKPATESSDTALSPGTIEGSAKAQDSCAGSYDVFFRVRLFNNGEMTFEQLLTAGGNPFQLASGFWGPDLAVATSLESTFFEVWYFYSMLADTLAIYNVAGPSSPLVTADSVVSLDDYRGVGSAEQLSERVGGGPDSCVVTMTDVNFVRMPFPEATG